MLSKYLNFLFFVLYIKVIDHFEESLKRPVSPTEICMIGVYIQIETLKGREAEREREREKEGERERKKVKVRVRGRRRERERRREKKER